MAVPPQKNTELTLKKLASLINTQWAAIGNKARQDDYIPPGFVGGRDAYVFAVLQRELPVNAAAAQAPPAGIAANTYYQNYTNWGTLTATYPNHQSAVCLYMILSVSHAGKTVDTDTLGSHEVGVIQVGGKPVKFLKDGWGNPIQFNISAKNAPQFSSWGPDGTPGTLDDLIFDNYGTAQNVLQ
jgi:hypothetical protein